MSQGRKIFRLLKGLQEIPLIVHILLRSNKPFTLKFLQIAVRITGFVYYIFDNILWGLRIGILTYFNDQNNTVITVFICPFFSIPALLFLHFLVVYLCYSRISPFILTSLEPKRDVIDAIVAKRVKYFKNQLSLCRNCLNLVCNILLARRNQTKIKSLRRKIESLPDEPMESKEQIKMLARYLKYRRSKRFQLIEVFQSFMRFVVLSQSLRLPFSNEVGPIFAAGINLLSSAISIFKAFHNKVRVVNEPAIPVQGPCTSPEDKNKLIKILSTAYHMENVTGTI